MDVDLVAPNDVDALTAAKRRKRPDIAVCGCRR